MNNLLDRPSAGSAFGRTRRESEPLLGLLSIFILARDQTFPSRARRVHTPPATRISSTRMN